MLVSQNISFYILNFLEGIFIFLVSLAACVWISIMKLSTIVTCVHFTTISSPTLFKLACPSLSFSNHNCFQYFLSLGVREKFFVLY